MGYIYCEHFFWQLVYVCICMRQQFSFVLNLISCPSVSMFVLSSPTHFFLKCLYGQGFGTITYVIREASVTPELSLL